MKRLISYAYSVRGDQIAGGPSWVDSEGFDIVAKAAAPAADDQIRLMLRSLLATRFKLVLHRETKRRQIFALVVGPKGPKIQQVAKLAEPASPNGSGISIKLGHMTAEKISMAQFADQLTDALLRPVIDMTGLQGRFDFRLDWAPDKSQDAMPMGGLDAGHGGSIGEEGQLSAFSGPSIFTALEEQLGLRLKPQKGPVSILVIDHVELPSAN